MDSPTPAQVFERHHLQVYRFLRRMTSDSTLAEDLTQDVFVRVLGALDRYEPRGREASWVFRIARNVLNDQRKSERRTPDLVEDGLPTLTSAGDPTLGFDLEQALSRVPVEEREALMLREYGGLGYEDISRISGVSPAAVRSRIYRARRAMRGHLSPSGGTR